MRVIYFHRRMCSETEVNHASPESDTSEKDEDETNFRVCLIGFHFLTLSLPFRDVHLPTFHLLENLMADI